MQAAEVVADVTTPVERPSQERYQTLIAERSKVAQHLAECEVLDALEKTAAPAGLGYDNLLEFRFPRSKNQQVPRGVKLQQQLVGTRAVLAIIDDELKVWAEEEEAYMASAGTSAA